MRQKTLIRLQFSPIPVEAVLHLPRERILRALQGLREPPVIEDRNLRGAGRRRGSPVRHIIRDDIIRFVPHRRDDRCPAFKYSGRQPFIVKAPEILHGSAAPADDDDIRMVPPGQAVQCPDSADNRRRRVRTLHQSRLQNDPDERIPPPGCCDNVVDGLSGIRGDHAERPHIGGKRLLIRLVEHSLLFELFLQPFKLLLQLSHTVQNDLFCIQLILPGLLIDGHIAIYNDLVSVLHREFQSARLEHSPHDTVQHAGFVLQRKINMSGGMILTVADLAPHENLLQHNILPEHISDIFIYLCDGINRSIHGRPFSVREPLRR